MNKANVEAVKIAALVITYNRKDLLIKCLDSISNQTLKPDLCLIVDHASTDGTKQIIQELGYDNYKNDIHFNYCYLSHNIGGPSLPIYIGMQAILSNPTPYDYIWLMDDDGLADVSQLERLLQGAIKYKLDFANALVVDIQRRDYMAFGAPVEYYVKDNVEILDFVNPFNGTLISCKSIRELGLVKKEMISWGLEEEYWERYKKYGYSVATIVDAIHYHPKYREKKAHIIPKMNIGVSISIPLSSTRMRQLYYQNFGYIDRHYRHEHKWFWLSLYFIFRFKLLEMIRCCYYYWKGYFNRYDNID